MSHLPYIVPSFAIGIIVPLALAASAACRLSLAKRGLIEIERVRGRNSDE